MNEVISFLKSKGLNTEGMTNEVIMQTAVAMGYQAIRKISVNLANVPFGSVETQLGGIPKVTTGSGILKIMVEADGTARHREIKSKKDGAYYAVSDVMFKEAAANGKEYKFSLFGGSAKGIAGFGVCFNCP